MPDARQEFLYSAFLSVGNILVSMKGIYRTAIYVLNITFNVAGSLFPSCSSGTYLFGWRFKKEYPR
jgi:hypothetical protein